MKTKQVDQPVRAAGMLLMTTSAGKRSFLLMRHSDRWDLPKGHCDGEETFLETAYRETEEETGIVRESIELDDQFQYDLTYPVKYKRHGDQIFQKQVRYFLGYLDQQLPIRVTEHESHQWFTWSPPHLIQEQTIDGLLAAVAEHFNEDAGE